MKEMFKRILVAVVAIPVIVFLIYERGIYFLVLSIVLQTLCIVEFLDLFRNKFHGLLKITIALISIILVLINYFSGNANSLYFIILAFVFFICIEIFRAKNKSPVNAILHIYSLIYISIPFLMLNSLLNNYTQNVVLFLVVLIWTCDTFSYIGGKYFGRHKLTEISPKKTIEGGITGFLFTMIVSYICMIIYPGHIILKDVIVVGLIAGVFGQLGDIYESMMKRYNDVKDSSGIIPGHGGVLDRFDSLIFTAPLVYIYYNFFR